MHSSRMRTGRSLTVCWSVLPGGKYLVQGGGWSGEVRSQGDVSLPGGVCSGGCLVPGGGLVPGGWFSLPGGWVLPAQGVWGSPCPETLSPVNRITHTCKNITLATTSLRPVKMSRKRTGLQTIVIV